MVAPKHRPACDVKRGGQFDKVQTLCELVLAAEHDAARRLASRFADVSTVLDENLHGVWKIRCYKIAVALVSNNDELARELAASYYAGP